MKAFQFFENKLISIQTQRQGKFGNEREREKKNQYSGVGNTKLLVLNIGVKDCIVSVTFLFISSLKNFLLNFLVFS